MRLVLKLTFLSYVKARSVVNASCPGNQRHCPFRNCRCFEVRSRAAAAVDDAVAAAAAAAVAAAAAAAAAVDWQRQRQQQRQWQGQCWRQW